MTDEQAGDRRVRRIGWLFTIAGVYGLLAVVPLYTSGGGGAALYRYAFAGAAGATQLLYLMIGRDFRRYRPLIWVGVASKVSFAVPGLWLTARGEIGPGTVPFAIIDLLLVAAFLWAWAITRSDGRRA